MTWLRPRSTATPTRVVRVNARKRRPNSTSPRRREMNTMKTRAIALDATWAHASSDQLRTMLTSGFIAVVPLSGREGRRIEVRRGRRREGVALVNPDEAKPRERGRDPLGE